MKFTTPIHLTLEAKTRDEAIEEVKKMLNFWKIHREGISGPNISWTIGYPILRNENDMDRGST